MDFPVALLLFEGLSVSGWRVLFENIVVFDLSCPVTDGRSI